MDCRTVGGVQGADPREIRGGRQPLARHCAAVGRRDHRPGADSRRAWPRLCRDFECTDPRASAVRRVQDVTMNRALSRTRTFHYLAALISLVIFLVLIRLLPSLRTAGNPQVIERCIVETIV